MKVEDAHERAIKRLLLLITSGYYSSVDEQMKYWDALSIKNFFSTWDEIVPARLSSELKDEFWQFAEFKDGEPDMIKLAALASDAVC